MQSKIKTLNKQIENMSSDEIQVALQQQNHGIILDLYTVCKEQQKILDKLCHQVNQQQKTIVSIADDLEKNIAKTNILIKLNNNNYEVK